MTDDSKASVLSVAQFRAQLEQEWYYLPIDALSMDWICARYAEARQAQEIPADGEDDEQPQRTLDIIARMLGWMNTPPRRTFEQEIRAMKARAEARQASAWQPISSAPKDGTPILAMYEHERVIVRWRDNLQAFAGYRQFERPWTYWMSLPPLPLAPPVLEDDAHER